MPHFYYFPRPGEIDPYALLLLSECRVKNQKCGKGLLFPFADENLKPMANCKMIILALIEIIFGTLG